MTPPVEEYYSSIAFHHCYHPDAESPVLNLYRKKCMAARYCQSRHRRRQESRLRSRRKASRGRMSTMESGGGVVENLPRRGPGRILDQKRVLVHFSFRNASGAWKFGIFWDILDLHRPARLSQQELPYRLHDMWRYAVSESTGID